MGSSNLTTQQTLLGPHKLCLDASMYLASTCTRVKLQPKQFSIVQWGSNPSSWRTKDWRTSSGMTGRIKTCVSSMDGWRKMLMLKETFACSFDRPTRKLDNRSVVKKQKQPFLVLLLSKNSANKFFLWRAPSTKSVRMKLLKVWKLPRGLMMWINAIWATLA